MAAMIHATQLEAQLSALERRDLIPFVQNHYQHALTAAVLQPNLSICSAELPVVKRMSDHGVSLQGADISHGQDGSWSG